MRRSGGPAHDKREAVGEHTDAPHTPHRSEEAEANSDEEHETRKQHTESESDDGSDAECAPVSWEQVVPRPAHEGTEHYDAVKAGYGGCARRGNSKPGGYTT